MSVAWKHLKGDVVGMLLSSNVLVGTKASVVMKLKCTDFYVAIRFPSRTSLFVLFNFVF